MKHGLGELVASAGMLGGMLTGMLTGVRGEMLAGMLTEMLTGMLEGMLQPPSPPHPTLSQLNIWISGRAEIPERRRERRPPNERLKR